MFELNVLYNSFQRFIYKFYKNSYDFENHILIQISFILYF